MLLAFICSVEVWSFQRNWRRGGVLVHSSGDRSFLVSRRQRSEQYLTSSQQRCHLRRQLNGRPQVLQCFDGIAGRFFLATVVCLSLHLPVRGGCEIGYLSSFFPSPNATIVAQSQVLGRISEFHRVQNPLIQSSISAVNL